MPKTKLQNVFFTILMAFLMVYAMICYNISLNIGGMTNQVFLMAFGEMKIMWPAAIILEFFVVEKLSTMLAFRIVSPQDKPIFITLAISSMIVCLMCPMMSFIATLLFKNAGSNFIAVWFQTTVMNFPMALCWQIFGAGPLGRLIFRTAMKAMGKQEAPSSLTVRNSSSDLRSPASCEPATGTLKSVPCSSPTAGPSARRCARFSLLRNTA